MLEIFLFTCTTGNSSSFFILATSLEIPRISSRSISICFFSLFAFFFLLNEENSMKIQHLFPKNFIDMFKIFFCLYTILFNFLMSHIFCCIGVTAKLLNRNEFSRKNILFLLFYIYFVYFVFILLIYLFCMFIILYVFYFVYNIYLFI